MKISLPIRRSNFLVQPKLQLPIVGSFVGLAALAMVLQFLFLGHQVTSAASEIEGMGGQLADEVPAIMLRTLGFTLAALLPVIFAMGVLLTQRIAGPAYRFEQYLRSVARGEQLGPCKIREKDHMWPLCDAINEATEPLRRRRAGHDDVEADGAGTSSETERLAG